MADFNPDQYLKEKTAGVQGTLVAAQPDQPGKIKQAIAEFMQNHPDAAKVIGGVGQVLDYPGGLLRTGLASYGGMLTGQAGKINDTDVMNALKDHAPNSAEYLERLGVSPGGEVLNNSYTGKITPRDIEGFALDVGTDPLTALSKAGLVGRPAGTAMEKAGTAAYKSGLKNLDMATARAEKAPVSDLLLKNGVWGNSQQVFDQMNELGKGLLAERNDILKRGTRAGAEVDMQRAMAPAQAYVDDLRKLNNPESKKLVDMMQSRINDYLGAGAKEPEQILRELPYTEPVTQTKFSQMPEALAYDAPNESTGALMQNKVTYRTDAKGKPIINTMPLKKMPGEPILEPTIQDPERPRFDQKPDEILGLPVGGQYSQETKMAPRVTTVLDETERVPGPTPIQTTGWKTNAMNRVGEQGYDQFAKTSQGKAFEKALASGLRGSTAESIGEKLGPDAAVALNEKNANLGQILSSDEKAYQELEKEARKNGFTSVDGMLALHPGMLATKKIADAAKGTWMRTGTGLGLINAAQTGVPDALLRRGIIGTEPAPAPAFDPDSYLKEKNIRLSQ